MRAPGMSRFDSPRAENEKNLLAACEKNVKIVGTYCIYSPIELILAAGAYPVSLCGTKQDTIAAAEKVLLMYAEKRGHQSIGQNTRRRCVMERVPRGRYTKEFRQEAVNLVIEGKQAAAEVGRNLSRTECG